uniref:Uncharacterized protein n=1 Tax=Anopheles minimus TaxID=112268 RepID=A0A182VXD3_9DIPT
MGWDHAYQEELLECEHGWLPHAMRRSEGESAPNKREISSIGSTPPVTDVNRICLPDVTHVRVYRALEAISEYIVLVLDGGPVGLDNRFPIDLERVFSYRSCPSLSVPLHLNFVGRPECLTGGYVP